MPIRAIPFRAPLRVPIIVPLRVAPLRIEGMSKKARTLPERNPEKTPPPRLADDEDVLQTRVEAVPGGVLPTVWCT